MKFKYLILAGALCGAWCVGIQAEKPAPDIQELCKQLWELTKDGGAKLAYDSILAYINKQEGDRYYRSDKESLVSIKERIIDQINTNLDRIKKLKEAESSNFVAASENLLAQQRATPQDPQKLSAAQEKFSQECTAYKTYLEKSISKEDKALKSIGGFGPQWDALWNKQYAHKGALTSLDAIKAYHTDLTEINKIIETNARDVLQNIKDLLAQGANPTIRFGDGYFTTSSIENAMKREDLGMLAAIFDWQDKEKNYVWRKEIDSLVGESFSQSTLLMQACKSKNLALITFLLERGADPNDKKTIFLSIKTPLSILLEDTYSVNEVTLKCLQELLKAGANPIFLEEDLIKELDTNPHDNVARSQLVKHLQEFDDLFKRLKHKGTGKEYATDAALLKDPFYKIIAELLAAKIIYTATIKPLLGKVGTLFAQIFKGYIENAGLFVVADKNFDPINKPYWYGKDDVKGKTPVELLVANGNSDYLAMFLETKRIDNGQSLVSLATAQNALDKKTDTQCKALLQHFIDYENALRNHSDITPFKDEELKNIETLLGILANNIKANVYKKDEEGKKAKQDLINTIADRLHALLIYEVSQPTKEDKKTKGLRRGDSKMVETYLKFVKLLRLPNIDPSKTLVDQPFQYGDETVKGKTPIELAEKNKHTYCLKKMKEFLEKK